MSAEGFIKRRAEQKLKRKPLAQKRKEFFRELAASRGKVSDEGASDRSKGNNTPSKS